MTSPAQPPRLHLRFLGEIEVVRDGERLPLPPSKKTRALLAYLAVTGRPHRRERLCAMLWEIPDDPRGSLRWSLSKLRPLVDRPDLPRILADRETVRFDAHGVDIDVLALRARLAPGLERLSTGALEEAAADFRGAFLEGVELTGAPEFHAWCVAEREDLRLLHARVLQALVRRLSEDPERALAHARQLTQLDPYDQGARARLIELLALGGRLQEAERQLESGMRLAREVGDDTRALAAAWRAARERRASAPAPPLVEPVAAEPPPCAPGDALPPLVGRESEQADLRGLLDDAARARHLRLALITGEPGIGKTRLLADLAAEARGRGGTVLQGAAYEAESGRPYGPWIDAFGGLPAAGADEPASRQRLFAAVVEAIASRAREAPPVLVLLDDIQWCDEASTALLHHVARMAKAQPLVLALAAQEGELPDNPAVMRVLHGLRREHPVLDLKLRPLDAEATARLVGHVAPGADGRRIGAESGGNPLFALELARALQGGAAELSSSLAELVRARIGRLSPEAQEVLRWCAVLGSAASLPMLEALTEADPGALVAALETLERHALLHEARDGAAGSYAFAHDLVRQLVYAGLSEPRRRLMHRRVARHLLEHDRRDQAAELVRHAALAGEAAMAAAACVDAGRRCLRLFANDDAYALARRGLHYAGELPEPERTRLQLELHRIAFTARHPSDVEEAVALIQGLAERALDHGCIEHARLGFHILAYLRWEGGDWSDATRLMMQAELISRSGDPRERATALAEAALCLALVERDLTSAEALLLEAEAVAARIGIEPVAVPQARGMLRRHQGRFDEAAALLERARALARLEGVRSAEFMALEHLVMLELERGGLERAEALCLELVRLGERLPEGSEAPFARALAALLAYAREPAAAAGLEPALEALRLADAKHRLAYVLLRAALIELDRGAVTEARARGEEALTIARLLEHASGLVLARVVLARAALLAGDRAALEAEIGGLARASLQEIAAPARAAAEAVLAEAGVLRLGEAVRSEA